MGHCSVALVVCIAVLAIIPKNVQAENSFDRFQRVNVEVSLMASQNHTAVKTAVYKPGVDGVAPGSMSALEDFFSFDNLSVQTLENTYVQVSIDGKNTSDDNPDKTKVQYWWKDGSDVYYAPFLTALVTLDQGTVQKIRWNWEGKGSRCSCGSNTKCHHNLYCGISKSQCEKQNSKNNNSLHKPCNLRIYLAFEGVTKNGQFCTSSNEMFSKFTALGVGSLASQIASGASSTASSGKAKLG